MCEIRNLRMQIVWHDSRECMPPAVEKNYLCVNHEMADGRAFLQVLSFNPRYMAFNADEDGDHAIKVRYWAECPRLLDIDHKYMGENESADEEDDF